MHIVAHPTKGDPAEFLLHRGDLDRQVVALNESFAPVNISFHLLDVDWISGKGQRTGMRSAFTRGLHRGDRTTLNIYWRNSTKLDYGGTTEIFTVTHDGKRDSMFVNAATIPGGAHPVWNQGKTVVHETGHWFGLDHTPLTDIGDCKWNWKNKPGMNNEYVPAPAQTSML
ncbi:Extracellular metalloprotease [Beauveria bassiana]|uniref:Extracellular metalloprotease n=1 Tax=Beauveria bassiana TaxID=176275 RepID=A0A2N6N7V1_BEABA|nr:Extracellular metalloprotease [Beauveria bassiana]